MKAGITSDAAKLRFRDPARARALVDRLRRATAAIGREPVSLMHVCGSHEQAIARFGLRAVLPRRARRHHGARLPGLHHRHAGDRRGGRAGAAGRARSPPTATWCACPARSQSLADAQAAGAQVDVVYSIAPGGRHRARTTGDEVVFFATGFETTAVATAAVILADLPPNFSVLSAHKYIPPVMEIVARDAGARASRASSPPATPRRSPAGASSRRSSSDTGIPVVVAGFEPLDILAALVRSWS